MVGGVSPITLLALLAPLPPAVLANLAVGRSWALGAGRALVAGTAAAVFLLGLADLSSPGQAPGSNLGLGLGTIGTGLLTLLLLWRPVRRQLAGLIPIQVDHPVHMLALALAFSAIGVQLSQQLFTDVLREEASSASPLTPTDLLLQEIPFLLLAVAGIGYPFRRSAGGALTRLSVVRPSLWQVLLASAAATAFFVFGVGMDELAHRLTPDLARRVDAANLRLFGDLATPLGLATIALAPGICEELLFRGAAQPRLGLWLTALVFTAFHTQYGLSLEAVTVLVLALSLGLIRRLTNTTTSTLTHVGFNGLQAAGLGVYLGWPLMAEAALVLGVFTAVAFRTRPRAAGQP